MNKIKQFFGKYKNSDVIFKATIWFVLVTVVDNAISIITQPFLNRILSVEQVGVYHVFSTWSTIFKIVATFNLFCGVYEVLLVDHKDDRRQVCGSLCVLSTLFATAFFAVVFIFINPVSEFLKLKPIYLVAMFLTILAESIIQFYIVPLRFQYKYIRYSVFVVGLFFVKSVLTVVFSYLFVNDRVFGRILGLALPSLVVAIILFISILKKTSVKLLTKYWKHSIKFNLPLIPHYLSSVLLASSDKVMIQQFTTEYYVGLYSVAYSFSSLSHIIFTAINNSYTPWAYNAIKQKNYSGLKKKTNTIILVSILFCVVLMLFAPEGIYLLGGEKYLKALPIIPILILGTFLSSFYFIFSNVEFIYKKTKLVFLITIAGSGVNIILNWILIPLVGYEIAAYTTVIGYLFISVCHYFYSYSIVKENVFDIQFLIKMLLLLFASSAGCIFIYKVHFLLRYVLAVAFGVAALYIFIKYSKKGKESEIQA